MAEKRGQESRGAKRTARRVRFAAIIGILATVAALIYVGRSHSSVDECLVSIEAARAIPDSENAAIVYNQLLEDPNASGLANRPAFLDNDSDSQTLHKPWSRKDYPELAAWIEERRGLVDCLLQASQFENCRFLISIEPHRFTQVRRLGAMRNWAFLLMRAANNDVGEGRIDNAIEKWQCLIRMGRHLRQQPTLIDYLTAMAVESIGINQTIAFLAEGSVDDRHLQKIKSILPSAQDDWTSVLDRILPVEDLAKQKFREQMGFLDRLKYDLGIGPFAGRNDPYPIVHQQHLRVLAWRRGMHIVVALRRCRNEHGRWPESLTLIAADLPPEALIDPQNNGPYVYRLTENGFRLYSRGPNGKDEEGHYKRDGPDDLSIWPRRQ